MTFLVAVNMGDGVWVRIRHGLCGLSLEPVVLFLFFLSLSPFP